MFDTRKTVYDILKLLNKLEDTLQDKYKVMEDNPGLITQLQAARNVRIILHNNFSYSNIEPEPALVYASTEVEESDSDE